MATRSEWAERVGRWQRSGLGSEEFAAREGVNPKRLVWWRWKLRSARPSPPLSTGEVRFLPVQVVDSSSGPLGAAVALEVVLPNGRVVRVAPGFDPGMLESVLSIASGGARC
jgi:transposase